LSWWMVVEKVEAIEWNAASPTVVTQELAAFA
jgi:hypothetical protein